jgi:hypothetical protein
MNRWTALSLVALVGCADRPEFDVTVQSPQTALRAGSGGFLSFEVLATDGAGTAVSCTEGELEVTVEIAGDDGHFADVPPQTWTVNCDDGRTGDLAVVVDNSGSEDGFVPWLKQGATAMVDGVVARGGRASLVRVSTEANVEVPLTDDQSALDGAIDELFVANGWTALYDGVRMGNETLGFAAPATAPVYDDLESFCGTNRTLGVVAFTDGADNNSSDEHAADYDVESYPGDGLDTTFEDLLDLRVGGVTTPLYTIGLGRDVESDALATLAEGTGGRYLHVDRAEQLPGVFDVVGDYFDARHQVCVELPELECGDFTVRVSTTWTSGSGEVVEGVVEHTVHMECEEVGDGRVATILLTMEDPGFPASMADQLARQVVEWVSPRLRPRVLVVLDDNHHGEDDGDALVVASLLSDDDNREVQFVHERDGGLTAADVDGYDVVWFSNPGYPMDDVGSVHTLTAFAAEGGGVVMQGDDMTWSWAGGFSMAGLTHLDHQNNGTSACGVGIDNRAGGAYRVAFGDVDHAVTRGLTGQSFRYSNDIDHSTARGEGEVVLASATVDGRSGCMTPVPVVVGYDPR